MKDRIFFYGYKMVDLSEEVAGSLAGDCAEIFPANKISLKNFETFYQTAKSLSEMNSFAGVSLSESPWNNVLLKSHSRGYMWEEFFQKDSGVSFTVYSNIPSLKWIKERMKYIHNPSYKKFWVVDKMLIWFDCLEDKKTVELKIISLEVEDFLNEYKNVGLQWLNENSIEDILDEHEITNDGVRDEISKIIVVNYMLKKSGHPEPHIILTETFNERIVSKVRFINIV